MLRRPDGLAVSRDRSATRFAADGARITGDTKRFRPCAAELAKAQRGIRCLVAFFVDLVLASNLTQGRK
jgi:hypothetical protein